MPFISKDWRSPGENWVKVGTGWERVKVLKFSEPPHFRINVRNNNKSREIRNENVLSEALHQLNFQSSSRNVRRFNYICQLLILLSQQMNVLPGNVQKMVLEILKQLVIYVRETKSRTDVIRFILENVKGSSDKFWGGNLGSQENWQNHKLALNELAVDSTNDMQFGNESIVTLPEEILRCIILRLNHHYDIQNFQKTNALIEHIGKEQRIWREMCKYHFNYCEELPGGVSWEDMYHKLKRKYGLREEFADYIYICRQCGLLSWNNFNECSNTECGNTNLVCLKPSEFLEYFSL